MIFHCLVFFKVFILYIELILLVECFTLCRRCFFNNRRLFNVFLLLCLKITSYGLYDLQVFFTGLHDGFVMSTL